MFCSIPTDSFKELTGLFTTVIEKQREKVKQWKTAHDQSIDLSRLEKYSQSFIEFEKSAQDIIHYDDTNTTHIKECINKAEPLLKSIENEIKNLEVLVAAASEEDQINQLNVHNIVVDFAEKMKIINQAAANALKTINLNISNDVIQMMKEVSEKEDAITKEELENFKTKLQECLMKLSKVKSEALTGRTKENIELKYVEFEAKAHNIDQIFILCLNYLKDKIDEVLKQINTKRRIRNKLFTR